MSREGKKLQHIHSSVPNKQPKPSILEVGELAVNNAAGNEFISTKNTDDEVVRFSSDKKVVSIIENKTVMPYKGEVLEPTEQDLIDNKSQIVIGLNQVAAKETFGYDQVNGAEDMHGDAINPSEDGGKTNGAGFAINMDRYAMIGANPSFSSITTDSMLSEDKLFIGNNEALEDGVDMPEVSVYGSSIKLHSEGGKVGITAGDDINISGMNDGNFNVENNMCIGSGNEMKIGAAEKLTIGEDCSGTETSVVEIKGGEIIINREATSNISATTVEGALEELAEKIAAAGDGYITGGHVDSGSGIISVDVLGQAGATIDGLEEYINNRLGDISGIAKRSEVTKETIGDVDKIVISFFDKDDNELEDLQIVLDDYYNKGEINDMELVIAAALNDLNDRVLDVSGSVITLESDVEELKNRRDNFVTDGEVNEDTGVIYLNMSASDEPAEVTGLAEYVESKVSALSGDTNDFVTGGSVDSGTGVINLSVKNQGSYPVTGLAAYVDSRVNALSGDTNDFVTGGSVNASTGVINLNVKNQGSYAVSGLAEYVGAQTNGLIADAEYVSSSKTIVFRDKNGNDVDTIDASAFVKDGMVSSVSVGVPTSGQHAGEDCLIITWNTDAGKDTTEIPLSEFFDPAVLENYYTKDEVNTMLGENFALDLYSGDSFSSVTEVILNNELVVAAALNDLNERVNTVSGDVITNTSNIENLDERVTILEGKEDKYLESGSFNEGTLTLNMSDGSNVRVSGISTGEGADGNDFVSSGTINASTGVLTLNIKNQNPVTINGLSDYVSSHDSNDYVTGGSVNDTTGAITLNMKSGGTATVSGLSEYVSKNDKYVASGSVNNSTGVINLSMSDGSVKTVTGLSEYVSAHDSNDYVTGGSVSSANGNITLNMKSGGTATVTGLNDYVSAHDKYITGGTFNSGTLTLVLSDNSSVQVPGISTGEGADGNDYVSGGSVNQANGNITLGVTNGYVANVTGLSNYIDSKTSGFSTTDIQVNGGSVNATNGVITLTRTDSKNPSSTVPSVTIDGLAAYVSSVTPADVWVNTSGDTMTGALTFKNGNNTVMTVDPAASNVLEIDGDTWMRGNLRVSDVLTIDGSVVEFDEASRMYVTGGTIPQDPRDDYGFVQGYNERTNLSQFLLPSGGTANSGKVAIVNSNGEWALSNGDWVDETGDTMTGNLEFNNGTLQSLLINANTGKITNGLGGGYSTNGGNIITNVGNISADHGDVHGQTVTVSGDSRSSNNAPKLKVYGDVEVYPSGTTSPMLLRITPDAGNGESILTVSGDITATGAMYSSDKRLKENIKFIPGDDLENAKKIDFKEFNFIADKSSQKVGVIAQELKENGLGKFTKQNDAGYLTVDYISLLCLKIAQLEKEIKELKEGK